MSSSPKAAAAEAGIWFVAGFATLLLSLLASGVSGTVSWLLAGLGLIFIAYAVFDGISALARVAKDG